MQKCITMMNSMRFTVHTFMVYDYCWVLSVCFRIENLCYWMPCVLLSCFDLHASLPLSFSLSLTRRRVRTRAERKITQFAHKTLLSTKHCACVYLCILIKFLDSITWIYLLFPNLLSFFSSPDFPYYFQSIFFIAIIDLIVDERLSKMRKNCLFFNFFFTKITHD